MLTPEAVCRLQCWRHHGEPRCAAGWAEVVRVGLSLAGSFPAQCTHPKPPGGWSKQPWGQKRRARHLSLATNLSSIWWEAPPRPVPHHPTSIIGSGGRWAQLWLFSPRLGAGWLWVYLAGGMLSHEQRGRLWWWEWPADRLQKPPTTRFCKVMQLGDFLYSWDNTLQSCCQFCWWL